MYGILSDQFFYSLMGFFGIAIITIIVWLYFGNE